MFGSLGGPEFLLIAVLALLLFGPRKLPQIGRSLGKALAEFRGATQEFKSSLEREVRLEEVREAREGLTSVGREIAGEVGRVTRPASASEAPGDGKGEPARLEADSTHGEKPPQP